MVDYEKIRKLQDTIEKNKGKLSFEDDYKKREELRIKIKIDELKIKLERLK
jgi:hypothetical protein